MNSMKGCEAYGEWLSDESKKACFNSVWLLHNVYGASPLISPVHAHIHHVRATALRFGHV